VDFRPQNPQRRSFVWHQQCSNWICTSTFFCETDRCLGGGGVGGRDGGGEGWRWASICTSTFFFCLSLLLSWLWCVVRGTVQGRDGCGLSAGTQGGASCRARPICVLHGVHLWVWRGGGRGGGEGTGRVVPCNPNLPYVSRYRLKARMTSRVKALRGLTTKVRARVVDTDSGQQGGQRLLHFCTLVGALSPPAH
jgi:hypothetical protein